jgi:hypothetical protein
MEHRQMMIVLSNDGSKNPANPLWAGIRPPLGKIWRDLPAHEKKVSKNLRYMTRSY